jgi:hypothetical protein
MSNLRTLKEGLVDPFSRRISSISNNKINNFSTPFKSMVPSFNLNKSFSEFNNNKIVSGSKEFLETNTMVAKFSFLLMIVILFIILLKVGTSLLSLFLMPSKNPKLISGVKEAHVSKIIPQNPSTSGSKTIFRSVNKQDGIEFTYSVWLFIEDLKNDGKYKHIFHKGNDGFSIEPNDTGINQPNNAPGLYIDKDSNRLLIIMNTYKTINEKVYVNDIPLNKWINVVIRVEGRTMDVYINGTIVIRHILSGVPKQNYGDIYVNMNGGFHGLLSDLWYHDYALTTTDILNIVKTGPDMTMDKSLNVFPPFLSMRWYFNQ